MWGLGRQYGKTFGAAILALQALRLGLRVLYLNATAYQTQEFWEVITKYCRWAPERVLNSFPNRLVRYDGHPGFIRARTGWDANTARGGHYHLVILDEVQLMKEEVFGRVVQPMLLRHHGDLVMIFTPPSLKTQLESKARDPRWIIKLAKSVKKKPHWEYFQGSSRENTKLEKPAFEMLIKDMTPDAIRQEIDAELDELDAGNLFDESWFGIAPHIPDNEIPAAIVRHWDVASKPGGGDYTVGLNMVRTNADRYYVFDVARGQWAPTRTKAEMFATANRDTELWDGAIAPMWSFPVDPGAAGVFMYDDLVDNVKNVLRRSPEPLRETGSKQVRAIPFAAEAGRKNVYMIDGEWNLEYMDELVQFPYGEFDDQVDASSGAYLQIQNAVQSYYDA